MINALKILLFTLLVTAFYTYVGQMVPQNEVHPPKELEISADMSTEEMVKVGEELMAGKGACLSCHTIGAGHGGRFPDLEGIGAAAAERRPGMSAVDYLAESLYDPNTYIVEGFNPGMPAVHKPPIGLTRQEVLCIIAYLQTLGGEPTVDMATNLKYRHDEPEAAPAPSGASPAVQAAFAGSTDGKTLFQQHGCGVCHKVDGPEPLSGPSLVGVGTRLSPAEIHASILLPDAVVAEGFAPGLMAAALESQGFYGKISASQLKALVDYLSGLKAGGVPDPGAKARYKAAGGQGAGRKGTGIEGKPKGEAAGGQGPGPRHRGPGGKGTVRKGGA